MGIGDKLKGVVDKGKDAVSKNADKIEDAVDKAGGFVDKKTKGKYSDKIQKGKEAAKKVIPPQA
ncbi:antitoxin [Antrihabitans stalactiti]|uniref:Antitoxin n=1 Tax=Antrihabitans stalactiti TaxID=2584121 RepID=A0A848KCC8_9NOCA|nr:antitoxin [Antrihabitans stalactiti]NMN96495.1 antitoxin [Antrihabitans stalactiti]